MERNFYDDELEAFLKQKTDQYQLHPSQRVWNGIYNFLHRGRKWYTVAGSLLLLTTIVFISLEIVSSGYNSAAYKIVNDSIINAYAEHYTPANTSPSFSIVSLDKSKAPFEPLLTAGSSFSLKSRAPGKDQLPSSLVTVDIVATKPENNISARHLARNQGSIILDKLKSANETEQVPKSAVVSEQDLLTAALSRNDNPTEENSQSVIKYNWLHEMATIKLARKHQQTFALQFYLSPTVSYRRLQNYNDPFSGKSGNISPLSDQPLNVNELVDHQPAMGLELGSALLFNASRKLVLKSGLQFNYVLYNIKAYRSSPERTAITLSSTVPTGRTETINAYSSIRNVGGNIPQELQNQYLQVSIPIGAEYKLLGNRRLQLNIAGTIQPTYMLYNKTYLLSNDYGNYTKGSQLVRNWNVNAAVESYLSYQAGGLRWQVGPQFRYQLLSTYTERYPIREYLMEYGIKVGVSKTLK